MGFTHDWVLANVDEATEKLNLYAERIEALERALGVENPGDRHGAPVVIELEPGRAMLKAHEVS